jgi:hypothetical protein
LLERTELRMQEFTPPVSFLERGDFRLRVRQGPQIIGAGLTIFASQPDVLGRRRIEGTWSRSAARGEGGETTKDNQAQQGKSELAIND